MIEFISKYQLETMQQAFCEDNLITKIKFDANKSLLDI